MSFRACLVTEFQIDSGPAEVIGRREFAGLSEKQDDRRPVDNASRILWQGSGPPGQIPNFQVLVVIPTGADIDLSYTNDAKQTASLTLAQDVAFVLGSDRAYNTPTGSGLLQDLLAGTEGRIDVVNCREPNVAPADVRTILFQ